LVLIYKLLKIPEELQSWWMFKLQNLNSEIKIEATFDQYAVGIAHDLVR
jgi:hypothetical protein